MTETVVHDYFHSKEVASLATIGSVITVKTTGTVEQAVKEMSKNKILSLPVINKKGECIGIIDTLDIVSFVLSVAPDAEALEENELQSLEIAGRAMALASIEEVVGKSGRDPYVPIYEKNPSSQAIELFAGGIHRAPILNDKEEIIGTISQSSIVRELAANLHMGKLKVLGSTKISDLGLGLVKPFFVKKTATVLEALNLIQKENISAVAVVDEESGRLVANFSGSDIKALYQEHWPSFKLTVEDFLKQHSEKSLTPICCQNDATFIDVCKEIASSRVHRIWVVDADYKPAGVISTTDISKICKDR